MVAPSASRRPRDVASSPASTGVAARATPRAIDGFGGSARGQSPAGAIAGTDPARPDAASSSATPPPSEFPPTGGGPAIPRPPPNAAPPAAGKARAGGLPPRGGTGTPQPR